MEPFEDDRLGAALQSLRPTPNSEFAAELDERAAAGFPRRLSGSVPHLGRLRAWLGSLGPRRVLVPAGAAALLAIVVATAVVATREPSENSSGGSTLSDIQYFDEGAIPDTSETPVPSSAVPERSSGAASAGVAPNTGPFAAKAGQREIERSAEIVLGTDPTEVGEAAAKVFDIVNVHRGIVLNSSTAEGDAGAAEARFELLIPSAKLGDAMADFSRIAEVRSRHEATADITAPTVSVGEHLRDSRARIDGLLAQLASADTDAEREAVETELRGERRHAAALRSRLSSLQRRANLSRVSLRIESGSPNRGASSDGSWGVGDALDDAGHILGIAAGVTVVGLAILAPLALIALLAWLASRAWIQRSRSRALD
jgi:hypothetical protein